MNSRGYKIGTLITCAGGLKNDVFLREHADITGGTPALPREPEAVLLGAAIPGPVAAKVWPDIITATKEIAGAARQLILTGGEVLDYHDRKYRLYHKMYDDQLAYAELMRARNRPTFQNRTEIQDRKYSDC